VIGGPVAMTSDDKGRALERAVHALERAILRDSPGFSERTFRVEPRKILLRDGVRHEIDLYVSIDITPAHSVVYVFECKNWAVPVGKNEIIIFSEKIAAADAQRGFFIARAFTKDAEAQAAKDTRIELLIANEPELEDIQGTVGNWAQIMINPCAIRNVEFFEKTLGQRVGIPTKIDPSTALLCIDGQPKPLIDWIKELGESAFQRAVIREDTSATTNGRYPAKFQVDFGFQDTNVMLNGARYIYVHLEGEGSFDVMRPQILSSFDVEKRGRFVHFLVSNDHFRSEVNLTITGAPGIAIRTTWQVW
jgi:hypothetical protein